VNCAAFARRYARDDVCSVLAHLLRVEGSLFPRQSLDNEPSLPINQNAQSFTSLLSFKTRG